MKELSLLHYRSGMFKEALLFVVLAKVFSILFASNKAAVKKDKLFSAKTSDEDASADSGGYKLNFIKWSMQ